MSMERLTSKRDWTEAEKDLSHEYGYSHIWRRLKRIEDVLGDVYDFDRLIELVESDKAGRVKIIPEYTEKACGDCAHFMRIKGTCHGECEIKPFTPRRNMSDRTTFEPAQSRKACKQYIGKTVFLTREAAEAALAKEADHDRT